MSKVVGFGRVPADVFSKDAEKREAAWAKVQPLRVPTRMEGEHGEIGDALLPLTEDHPEYEEWLAWYRENPDGMVWIWKRRRDEDLS